MTKGNDFLNDWKEMMCTMMQKSLYHCETPDGIILMGDPYKGYCRYSHLSLVKSSKIKGENMNEIEEKNKNG